MSRNVVSAQEDDNQKDTDLTRYKGFETETVIFTETKQSVEIKQAEEAKYDGNLSSFSIESCELFIDIEGVIGNCEAQELYHYSLTAAEIKGPAEDCTIIEEMEMLFLNIDHIVFEEILELIQNKCTMKFENEQ